MTWKLHVGDALTALQQMPDASMHACVTSPPYYGLRDYGVEGQIGLEKTPGEYVGALVGVFSEVYRVLRDDATLWIVIGDSYASGGRTWRSPDPKDSKGGRENRDYRPNDPVGVKQKDLLGIPWLLAFALRDAGWYLRQEIVWAKSISGPLYRGGSCMPESVKDRFTKSHETIFLLSKKPRYSFDHVAVQEPASTSAPSKHWKDREHDQSMLGHKQAHGAKGRPRGVAGYAAPGKRNMRSVWHYNPKAFKGAHFAVYPPALIEPMVLAATARNICPECGAPWKRLVERTVAQAPRQRRDLAKSARKPNMTEKDCGRVGNLTGTTHTLGFEPSCDCVPFVSAKHHGPAPSATVLDPFAGAGTTGVVCIEHGRNFVGIELNPEYAALARGRLVEAWRDR
jgi:DNA modification methylase